MKLKPMGSRVLVRRTSAQEKSEGGIFIPESAQEKSQEAEVIAIGTGGKDEDGNEIIFNVKEGDRVLISKYGGTEVKLEGEEVVILKQKDILAVVAAQLLRPGQRRWWFHRRSHRRSSRPLRGQKTSASQGA
jgi:chaperonin GroES